MHLFLDESGNFPKDGEDFFVLGSFTVGDPHRTAKRFHEWRVNAFPRKFRHQAEVKFIDNHLDESLRLRAIAYLAKLDIRIVVTYFDKRNIPEEYRRREGGIQRAGYLYASTITKTIELYLPTADTDLRVYYDRRNLQGLTRRAFQEIVRANVLPKLAPRSIFEINDVDSTTDMNVQIADWVASAFGRYHNRKAGSDRYYQLLRNNLIQHRELFAEQWDQRQTETPTGDR